MTPQVVHADWIVPGDEVPIADGAVVLDARRTVLDVGSAADVLPRHAGARVTRVAGIVTPGLVNAHTHLELSGLRGQVAGGDGFVPWAERMVRARRMLDGEASFDAMARAVDDIVASGTAAIGDVGNSIDAVDLIARRGLAGWFFLETSDTAPAIDVERMLADAEALARGALRCALVPHALYSTHAARIGAIAARGTRVSIHLAEFAAERVFLRDRSGPLASLLAKTAVDREAIARGDDPIDALLATSLHGPAVVAVHLADAKRAELDRLAASGTQTVLCPRSNLFIQTLLPPLLDVLAAGLRPALGTDSLASNTSLDVLAEAAALRFRFPSVPARTLVAMCTAYGADALGFEDVGRLRVGARPGLVAFEPPAGSAVSDPCDALTAQRPPPRRWLVRREPVAQ